MPTSELAHRHQAVSKATLYGAGINVVLAFAKIITGYVSQSQALIADGVHSFADLISDMVVLFASKQGSQVADEKHPYGHGRIETLVTVGLGIFLIAVAIGIMLDAALRLLEPTTLLHPGWIALVIVLVSIVAKEGLYRYTAAVAKRYHSNLLMANAWHHRSDAISSIIAMFGIMGSLVGMHELDAAAAIGVSVLIAKSGWDISWQSVQELADVSIDSDRLNKVHQVIESIEDVKAFHLLRTRSAGGAAFVDVHILVDPFISVSEGHQIGEIVRKNLQQEIDEITDVTIHIDPEDDETHTPCSHLPLRGEVLNRLKYCWREWEDAGNIKRITLHYLAGKILVEVLLPLELMTSMADADALAQQLANLVNEEEAIKEVLVNYG